MGLFRGVRPGFSAAAMALVALSPVGHGLSAQPLWQTWDADRGLSIHVARPRFDDFTDIDFVENVESTSLAAFVAGRLRISESLLLVAEVPLSRYGFSTLEQDIDTETTFGNPYLGCEIVHGTSSFTEIGIWLPLKSDDSGDMLAMVTGQTITGRTDRVEAFLHDQTLSISAASNVIHEMSSGLHLRLRAGPTILLDTGDNSPHHTNELIVHYGGHMWTEPDWGYLGAGVTGVAIVSEDGIDLAERIDHQALLSAALDRGTLMPGVQIRIPLDEGDRGELIVGIILSVRLE